jgi:hypothetical protein
VSAAAGISWCVTTFPRSDSFTARTSNSCSTQYVLNVKVEHPGNAQPWSIGINSTLTIYSSQCEATLEQLTGTGREVSRIVSAVALLVVVAGCGGAATPQTSAAHGVPRGLAQAWAGQASAIASAAVAGNDCRAMRLAASLRDEISASRHKLPMRLRTPLLTGVNALADRISTCTRVVTVQTPPTKGPPPKGPKPKPPHGPGDKHGGPGSGK